MIYTHELFRRLDFHKLNTNFDCLFANTKELARLSLSVSEAQIFFLSADGNQYYASLTDRTSGVTLSDSLAKVAVESKTVLTVNDLRNCSLERSLEHELYRSFGAAPIMDDSGIVIGFVGAYHQRPKRWSNSQRRLLELLAKRIIRFLEAAKSAEERGDLAAALQKSEQILMESEQRYMACLEAMHDGFVLQAADGTIHMCNARACDILGLSRDQLTGRASVDPSWHCVREDGSPFPGEEHPSMVSLATGERQQNVRMGVRKLDGQTAWININASPLFRQGAEKPYATVVTFSDATEEVQTKNQWESYVVKVCQLNVDLEVATQDLQTANEQLAELAYIDGLTGLHNHRSFQTHLEESLRTNDTTGLLLLDADHFKKYNDAYGHPAGDMVLKQIAKILTTSASEGCICCRYGGEEFAIIAPCKEQQEILDIAERVCDGMRAFDWPLRKVTVSIGISLAIGRKTEKSVLINQADTALYQVKAQGRDGYQYFRENLGNAA